MLPPKHCNKAESVAFAALRGSYRATITDADEGSLGVSNPQKFFTIKVIYISKKRFNAGLLEKELIDYCKQLNLPNLMNKNRGNNPPGPFGEYHAVSISYLDLKEYVIHSHTVGTADWSPSVDTNAGAAAIYCPPDG